MKKWNKWKAFTSVLLCICMIFTMIPVSGLSKAYASEAEANEALLMEVYELLEEAEGKTPDEQLAGGMLDEIKNVLGNPSEIIEKIKDFLGNPSDFLKKLAEMLKLPEGTLEYLKELLKDPQKLIATIKSLIEGFLDKGAIMSISAEAILPEIGKPVAAASLIKTEEDAEYYVERAVYVTDGTESEEERTFTPYEAFQIRVTFRAKEGKRFGGQIFTSMIQNAETWTVEKSERGIETGESRAYVLVSLRALKQLGPIAEVSLTVDPPLSGLHSSEFEPFIEAPIEHSYQVGGSFWCDASGEELTEDVVFEAGKTYYLFVFVSSDEECSFVEGSTSVTVQGGSLVSGLAVEDDGTSASALISVTAKEAPAGLIDKVSLSLTLPGIGQEYEQNGTESLTPSLELSIPEGAPYTFGNPSMNVWFLDNFTEKPKTEKFSIENSVYNVCYTVLKAGETGVFYKRAIVEIENANVSKVEQIDDRTLGITFTFIISESVNVRVCDTAGNIEEGGIVRSVREDSHGQKDETEISSDYELAKNADCTYTLTAVPADGYEFVGWYGFDPDSETDFENPGPAYNADQLISADPVLTYKVSWGGDVNYCAVFKGNGASVKLNKTTAKVLVGKTLQLKATPSDVTWKSGDTKIATVSKKGLVTAKAPGTVTIRAQAANGAKAYCKVTVNFRYVYQCEKNGVYRYTTNATLVKELKAAGWSYKKAFRAPGLSKTKVYWVYNKTTKRYRWTTDLAYAKKMKNAGNKAGLAFYSADTKTVPVYELQKGNTYFYTMKKADVQSMKNSGWTYTGIAWYAQPKA